MAGLNHRPRTEPTANRSRSRIGPG